MKAFFCLKCNDLMAIKTGTDRTCSCGQSGGRYEENRTDSTFWGFALPIGISVRSLWECAGDREERIPDDHSFKHGWPFVAWVYAERAGSINGGHSTRMSLGLEEIAIVLSRMRKKKILSDEELELADGMRMQLYRKMRQAKARMKP